MIEPGGHIEEHARQSDQLHSLLATPVSTFVLVACVVLTMASWVSPTLDVLSMDRWDWWMQPWFLVTAAFLHVSIPHLVFNLLWFWYFGRITELAFGRTMMLLIILALAMASSLTDLSRYPPGSIGLSGVIYGLFGLWWVLSYRDERYATYVKKWMVYVFIVSFFVSIILTATDVIVISNEGHAGGFLLGVLLGLTYKEKSTTRYRWPLVVSGLVIIALISTVIRPYVHRQNDFAEYLVAKGIEDFENRRWSQGTKRSLQSLTLTAEPPGWTTADSADWALYFGWQALGADRNEEAYLLYCAALQVLPERADGWFNRGIAASLINDWEDAIMSYERAVAIEPDNEEFQQAATDAVDYFNSLNSGSG